MEVVQVEGVGGVAHQRSFQREVNQKAILPVDIDINALPAKVQENHVEKVVALAEILHQIVLEKIRDILTVNEKVLPLDENHGEAAEAHLQKYFHLRRKIAEGEIKKEEQVILSNDLVQKVLHLHF